MGTVEYEEYVAHLYIYYTNRPKTIAFSLRLEMHSMTLQRQHARQGLFWHQMPVLVRSDESVHKHLGSVWSYCDSGYDRCIARKAREPRIRHIWRAW